MFNGVLIPPAVTLDYPRARREPLCIVDLGAQRLRLGELGDTLGFWPRILNAVEAVGIS